MKNLFLLLFFITSFRSPSQSQFLENFEGPGLSAGTLTCWKAEYSYTVYDDYSAQWMEFFHSSQQPLNSFTSSIVTIAKNNSTAVAGTGSMTVSGSELRMVNSDTGEPMVGDNLTVLTSPGTGADGNTISFDIRLNTLALAPLDPFFTVRVMSGNFVQDFSYSMSDIGNTFHVSTVISGSGGGGPVKIGFLTKNEHFSYSPTVSYSVDIDNFTTTAIPTPGNSCIISLGSSLLSLTGKMVDCGTIQLSWEAANSDVFTQVEIERSEDRINYKKIKTIDASEVRSTSGYTCNSQPEGNFFYRLKLFSYGGKIKYSPAINVRITCAQQGVRVYPNPAGKNCFIEGLKVGQLLRLYNSNGQLLITKSIEGPRQELFLKDYVNGVYNLIVSDQAFNNLYSVKIMKTQ